MYTIRKCVAALISLLPLYVYAWGCVTEGKFKLNMSNGFVCAWTIQLESLDAKACDSSGGFLFVIRNQDTQLLLVLYIMMSGLQDNVWVGATLTRNGTAVDTDGQALSYTNFAKDHPRFPDVNTCVVLNEGWEYQWKNINFNSNERVYALCTEFEVSNSLSSMIAVPTLSSEQDTGLTNDSVEMAPDLNTVVEVNKHGSNSESGLHSTETESGNVGSNHPAKITELSTNGPGLGTTETLSGTTELGTNGPGFGTTETISDTTEHSTNGPGFGTTETISDTTELSTNGPGFGTTETISDTTEHSTNGPGFGATETISDTTEHSTNGPGFGTTETISETTVSATPISASPSTTYLSDVSSTSTQTISATVLDKTQSDSNIATSSLDDVSGVYTITSTESASGSLQNTAVSACQSSTSFGTDSCCCVCAPLYQDTTANIANILEEFRQILTVDRASLSSTYRRKHSMADNRNTSVYMGCVAIVILVVVLVTIIFLDLSHFLFRR